MHLDVIEQPQRHALVGFPHFGSSASVLLQRQDRSTLLQRRMKAILRSRSILYAPAYRPCVRAPLIHRSFSSTTPAKRVKMSAGQIVNTTDAPAALGPYCSPPLGSLSQRAWLMGCLAVNSTGGQDGHRTALHRRSDPSRPEIRRTRRRQRRRSPDGKCSFHRATVCMRGFAKWARVRQQQVLTNLEAVLKAGGASLESVIKTTVFIKVSASSSEGSSACVQGLSCRGCDRT